MLAGASNNHGVAAMTSDERNQKQKIATAIFPGTASLLNHSCNPNTATLIQKDFQIVYAVKTIQQGEEISDIYKCHFCETPLEIRQKQILESYHFKCTCTACVENYATFNELPEENFNDAGKYLFDQIHNPSNRHCIQMFLKIKNNNCCETKLCKNAICFLLCYKFTNT